VCISVIVNLRSFWKRFPAEVFLTGWAAQAVEEARRCVQCGECEEKRPYHLPIREMLTENLAFYDRVISQARRSP